MMMSNHRGHKGAIAALTLATVLGLTGSLWIGQALTTAPPAYAYTDRVSLFLSRERGESFETLIRRSEAIARAGAQRSFDADLLVSEVVVTVVGENQGFSVPILTLQVTRDQWRNQPDPRFWATYYSNAKALLGF